MRRDKFLSLYKHCHLCPRACGVDRTEKGQQGYAGFCKQNCEPVVAYVGPHFGEEPPIAGVNGSGTVFFGGCSLGCVFCQNHQISHDGIGQKTDFDGLLARLTDLIQTHHVHNLNFVTPDHFFPHIFDAISFLRQNGFDLPMVSNLSGYQSVDILKTAEDYFDIYLADFKFSDSNLAKKLSRCKNYPETALAAISEMVRQKGFLDSCQSGAQTASKGALVRHLILPGWIDNSLNALTTLFVEFGSRLPVSIMSQYYPTAPLADESLNQFVSKAEFDQVYEHAIALGFEDLFVQAPPQDTATGADTSRFRPDFTRLNPFGQ
jgi:putative pyruvate formate lyase activating enzyme